MAKKECRTTPTTISLQTVKKHNALIQISNYVTAFERQLYNVLLALAQRSQELQQSMMEHTAPLAEVLDMMGVDIRNVNFLRQALLALTETTVEFSLLDNRMNWSAAPLLTFVSVHDGVVEWHYSKAMAERLGNPNTYTILSLLEERVLDSKYSRALYENIMRFKNIGHTGHIPLETLYKLLGVEYSDVRAFQRFVLRPALRELHQKLGLSVIEKASKRGRNITGFTFTIQALPSQALSNKERKKSPAFHTPSVMRTGLPAHTRSSPTFASVPVGTRYTLVGGTGELFEKVSETAAQKVGSVKHVVMSNIHVPIKTQ
jgi:hypothetical protein